MRFADLRKANVVRLRRWHRPGTLPWVGVDWSNAMCGEAGETANVVKKIRRIETGTGDAARRNIDDLRAQLADELADTVIYADLLADYYGIDLGAAVVAKFNAVSEREGFPERLSDDEGPS